MTGVRISTTAPAWFILSYSSDLGPADISPGTTGTFTIDYSIGDDATEGPFDVGLAVLMTSTGTVPGPLILGSTVGISFGEFYFLSGAQRSALRGLTVRGRPKSRTGP